MAMSKYSSARGRRGYGSKSKYGSKGKYREGWNGSRYGGGRYRRYGYGGGGVSSKMKSYIQREVEKVRLGPRRWLPVKVEAAEAHRRGRGGELEVHIEGPESVKKYAFLPVTALVAPQRHLAMPNPAYRLGNEVMIKGVRLTFDVMQTDQVRFMVFAFRNVKREQGASGALPYEIHRVDEGVKGVAGQVPNGVSFFTLSKGDVFGVGKVAGQMMLNGGPFLVNTVGDDWRTAGDSAFTASMEQKALLGKWSVEVDKRLVSKNAKVAAHNFKVDGGMRAGGMVSQAVSSVRCFCDFGNKKVRYLSALSSDGVDKSVELFVMWECPRSGVADAKALTGAAVANVSLEVYYRG